MKREGERVNDSDTLARGGPTASESEYLDREEEAIREIRPPWFYVQLLSVGQRQRQTISPYTDVKNVKEGGNNRIYFCRYRAAASNPLH